jgi:hypothetical protein
MELTKTKFPFFMYHWAKYQQIMTELDLKEGLRLNKTSGRKKAAKEIGKQKLTHLGVDVYAAYLREKKDTRTWETKVELIRTLGLLRYMPALLEIEEIIETNIPLDMITIIAAQAYVRLKRRTAGDATAVIKVLKAGGLSTSKGALNTLASDRMIPEPEQIAELITLSWDLDKHPDRAGRENGIIDPRLGLIVACAGWNPDLTNNFLIHCINTFGRDSSIKEAAENSLKGKYSKFP